MSLVSLADLQNTLGLSGTSPNLPSLEALLQELQGITLSVVSGQTNGGVAMPVSGIATEDTILKAWEVKHDALPAVDRTASTYISADGAVKCNEGLGATAHFFVLWANKTP